jgi:uncharacterized protein (DUF1778 family)
MSTRTIKSEKTRFDARLTKEQKQFLERAAAIGGYRSLSDFVLSTVEERAQQIITESEKIIASRHDAEIFFNAITNAAQPNEALRSAVEDYKKLTAE